MYLIYIYFAMVLAALRHKYYFILCHGGRLNWLKKTKHPEKTIDLLQGNDDIDSIKHISQRTMIELTLVVIATYSISR